MNFLAHLFLSKQNEDLMIGNFIADFIKNKDLELFTAGVRQGVDLHRKIDSYTDSHVVVRSGTQRLRAAQGKYAPVAVDVFYDYVLFKNWGKYTDEAFEDFAERVYELLSKRKEEFPDRLKLMTERMVAGRWLRAYCSIEGLDNTFLRIKKRTNFPNNIQDAAQSLAENYLLYEAEFNQFFPEIQAFVGGTIAGYTETN